MNAEKLYQQLLSYFPREARASQKIALQEICKWAETNWASISTKEEDDDGLIPPFFGCDAPTGVGKSYIALALARGISDLTGRQVWIVTQNKNLQDQYESEFSKHLLPVKGLGNYRCFHDHGKTCDTSRCGRLPPSPGTSPKFPENCMRNCEYDQVMAQSLVAPILSLNAAKAFNLLKFKRRLYSPALIIYDEGHGIEGQLDGEASITVKPDELQKLNVNFDEYFTMQLRPGQPGSEFSEILGKLAKAIWKIYEDEASAPESVRDVQKLKRADRLFGKINEVLLYMTEGIEFVNCSTSELDLRPLEVKKVFEKLISTPVVFLSATLLSHIGFASTLGLDPQYMDWVSLDSPFPVENRPLRNGFGIGATPINFNNKDREKKNVLERVRYLMEKYQGQKGIIHTHTYGWAKDIVEGLPQYAGRFLYPRNAAEQKEILTRHKNSKDTVLISPSLVEGIDLKGDEARFAIMVKVPFLPTVDPVVKARMEKNPTWYAYRTIMTIVQAAGRGVRSEDDTCDTYFVDPAFPVFMKRNRGLFPPWFVNALDKKFYGQI